MIPTNMFTGKRIIGKGTFGKVYDFGNCVVKFIPQHQTMMKEVEILGKLDHQNIVKMIKFQKYENGLLIWLQKCDNDIIQLKESIREEEALQVIYQIGNALNYMHWKNIIHRDIKLENILFKKKNSHNVYKLADFGLSLHNTDVEKNNLKPHAGTTPYMAPQRIQKRYYNFSSDIWSLGIVFYRLLFWKDPFSSKSLSTNQICPAEGYQFLRNIQKLKFQVSKIILMGMLQFSTGQRMPLFKLLNLIVSWKTQKKQIFTMVPIQRPLQKVQSNQRLNNNLLSPQREIRPISANKAPVRQQIPVKRELVRPNQTTRYIQEKNLMQLLEIELKSKYIPFSIQEFSNLLRAQIDCREKQQFQKVIQGFRKDVLLLCEKSLACLKK